MSLKLPVVLTIAGSDPSGGAGIQADLKTIAALGGYGMSVITALTAQNTLGVEGIFEVPVAFIERQFDVLARDVSIDAAKTGMLVSPSIVRAVAGRIREHRIARLLVDPVMISKNGTALLEEEAREVLAAELLPLAYIVTPNIPEAAYLAGEGIASIDDMKQAAKKIHGLGPCNVLVKGGHLEGEAVDILYDGLRFQAFGSERIETRNTHGTGCTYGAAIATGVARGLTVPEAVERAKRYIIAAIRFSFSLGAGQGPLDHMAALLREKESPEHFQD
ncbi:MAG: bifunctional hydroxymethylpyrimidine kinase/phosphomethylpyrimidine kinase [Deltaproteobacteria bacterium]|nr:bifunctional hydroxymethylpyrimidine kinase/phosphomethylpyrimidine kinase [Deltaproteobacteria bacterium]